ncbi:extracellular matrix protein 1-like isoform X3 [Vombatus ursinus]|uniref:extracellular matrix protein 1-like isoform X3 n=1 Tax=Vombatus ursinus TaxID=29139 RepID=UPI000FFDB3E0|nr:extracellular matrix protein 1-like isoform X3 [Vombatus ursinus]XP_027717969.1 extracellular matrix protein 1-like isoform X3 [Vombatus ursinus]
MPNACPTMGCLSTTALVFVVLALGASASQGGPKPSEQREVIPEHLFFSQEEVGYAAPPAPSRPQKPILKDPIPSQHIFEGQKAVDDIFEDVPLQQAQRPQRIPLEKKVPIPNEAIPLQEEVRPSQHLPVEQKEVECPFHPPKDHGFSPQEQKEIDPSHPEGHPNAQRDEMTTPQMINEHPGPEFSHPNKPHHCQQDSHSRGWSHKLDGFPPGRPSPDNINRICFPERKHVVYGPWNLPQTGYSHLSRQGNALNFLETGYTDCCRLKTNQLDCATAVWEDVLDSYCEEEMAIKTHHHTCCHRSPLSARDACFARHAPYPNYDRDILTIDLSRITPDTMNQLCGHRKVLTKHKQIPGLIRNMTARCCELPPPERGFCAEEEKSAFIEDLCGSRRDTWRDTDFCCDETPGYGQTSCFNAYYLRNVALVAGVAQKPKDQPGTGTTELPPASPTPEHKGK